MINRFVDFFSFVTNSEKIRFLMVGGVNTLFGFAIGVVGLNLFMEKLPVFMISILTSVIAILFSFTTQKFFVFRNSNKSVFKQFFRALSVYLFVMLSAGILIHILLNYYTNSVYLAQFFLMLYSAITSYIGLKYFVFHK